MAEKSTRHADFEVYAIHILQAESATTGRIE